MKPARCSSPAASKAFSMRAVHSAARGKCIPLAALVFFAVIAATAHAEKTDRDKPIQLEADRVTVDDVKQISVFSGNVVLTQGSMVIRGERLEVRQDKEGFRQGTTWGNLAY